MLLNCLWLGGCAATGKGGAPAQVKPTAPAPLATAGSSAVAPAAEVKPAPTPALPASGGPGWLGVELARREDGQAGVLIRSVMRGSPAAEAGVAAGDIVLSVDGENVERPHALRERIMATRAGTRVSLGVLRGDALRLFGVELRPVPNEDEVMRKQYVGASAPDFGALDSVQGSITPSLPALRGRVVVLEFWASWCQICHVLAPTLSGWHDRYGGQGVTVLGVTTDPVALASRTAGELRMGYPLASDGSGNMQRAYRAYALPTLFVIDKQGKVRDVLVGFSTPRLREIEALVRKLIAEG